MAAFIALVYWFSGDDPGFVILHGDLLLGLLNTASSPQSF